MVVVLVLVPVVILDYCTVLFVALISGFFPSFDVSLTKDITTMSPIVGTVQLSNAQPALEELARFRLREGQTKIT